MSKYRPGERYPNEHAFRRIPAAMAARCGMICYVDRFGHKYCGENHDGHAVLAPKQRSWLGCDEPYCPGGCCPYQGNVDPKCPLRTYGRDGKELCWRRQNGEVVLMEELVVDKPLAIVGFLFLVLGVGIGMVPPFNLTLILGGIGMFLVLGFLAILQPSPPDPQPRDESEHDWDESRMALIRKQGSIPGPIMERIAGSAFQGGPTIWDQPSVLSDKHRRRL